MTSLSSLQYFSNTLLPQLVDEGKNPWLRLLRKMGDGVLVVNELGEACWANRVLREQMGIEESLEPQRLFDNSPGSLEAFQNAVKATLASGRSSEKELNLNLKTGAPAFFNLHVIPLFDKVGIADEDMGPKSVLGCVAVFRDVTTIRQAEKIRRDFVANVSHELRTPLSVLKGYAETLLAGALKEPELAEDFLKVMERHADRLSSLVEDLLDLSRMESEDYQMSMETLELQPLLERAMTVLAPKAEAKGIHLNLYDPSRLLLKFKGNAGSIEQVLINLIDNAVKYSPEGADVYIYVKNIGRFLEVSIKDNGMGIESKHLARLFERFYRVDKARSREMGGTGLGLSIVKHIIQAHGGHIDVESKPGEGSRFFFTLPKVV